MGDGSTIASANAEAIEAWDGVLFDRWLEFRHIYTTGLGRHSDEAMHHFGPKEGERVIDLGCGLGDTTQDLAHLVGAGGEAVGVDSSPRFVEAARREAAEAGISNVSFEVTDVEAEVPGSGYDLAFSRMGTMFFANPVAAMRNVRSALRPRGRFCVVVWRLKAENEAFYRAEHVVERFLSHPDETDEPTCGPGPFSMANADTTSGILKAAGFEEISLRRCDLPIKLGDDIAEAVSCITALGPAAELIRVNEEEGERLRPKIEAALKEELGDLASDNGVWAPASTWIVTARNSRTEA